MREEDDRPLADRREDPEIYNTPEIDEEVSPSATDPANQPQGDPQKKRVYGESEGYEKPTEV